MNEVLKKVFGDDELRDKHMGNYKINWVSDLPKVQIGESPYAVLRFVFLYNGEKLIQEIDDYDVSFPFERIDT
jgi:hypothetical protein